MYTITFIEGKNLRVVSTPSFAVCRTLYHSLYRSHHARAWKGNKLLFAGMWPFVLGD
jgi:hypothetical protein